MTSFSLVPRTHMTLPYRLGLTPLGPPVAFEASSRGTFPHRSLPRLSSSIPSPFPYDPLSLPAIPPPCRDRTPSPPPLSSPSGPLRRMGTRDALLQIQMGTYANGVTCYYTFPYTNNVLIGPTPYVRRVWGAEPPVSTLSLSHSSTFTPFSLAFPPTTRAGSSAASAERISDIRDRKSVV